MLKLASGAVLSLVFEAGLRGVVWGFLLHERGLAALVLTAFFPGSIYQQAVFPVSLFLLCAVAFLALCERQKWAPAAGAGALAAMAYPTGFLLAPLSLLRRNPWPAAGGPLGLFAALPAVPGPAPPSNPFLVLARAAVGPVDEPVARGVCRARLLRRAAGDAVADRTLERALPRPGAVRLRLRAARHALLPTQAAGHGLRRRSESGASRKPVGYAI